MRIYLLAFNDNFMNRRALLTFLNTRKEVLNWYAYLPGSIFIISRGTAAELAELLRGRFPGLFFSIALIEAPYTDGWLPKEAWAFIQNPKSSGRWEK